MQAPLQNGPGNLSVLSVTPSDHRGGPRVGPADGTKRSEDAVAFHSAIDLAAPPDAVVGEDVALLLVSDQ